MWRLFGEFIIQSNFPIIPNIGKSLNKHGGVRGERIKKLEEFFYPLSLKDTVFKTERQFPPPIRKSPRNNSSL